LPKVIIPTHRHTQALMEQGYRVVVGIDEVGRGALAGPVAAAAVILPAGIRLHGIRDSKMLASAEREKLAVRIKRAALAIGLGWSSHREVDRFGLTWAVQQSGLRALNGLGCQYDAVLLDGNHNYLHGYCFARTLIQADALCLNVACASIIAKVARDRYMVAMHRLYPQFGFDRHKGYATRQHLDAIKEKQSPIHRQRFSPLSHQLSMMELLS
jgi:ribonuclease HII